MNNIIWNNQSNFDDLDEKNNDEFANDDFNNVDIHISLKPNGNKMTTIITGLTFENKAKNDEFLKNIKKKFGINGCFKANNEKKKTKLKNIESDDEDSNDENDKIKKSKKKVVSEEEKSFIFSGDNRDKIQTYLINEIKISEEFIKMHG